MLCIEKRLDWELDGVKVALEGKVTGEDCGLVEKLKCDVRGEGVVPYGCALLKLYAGSRKNPLLDCLAGHETKARGSKGDEVGEPAEEALSYSAKRQASEQ